ncbi:MAG: UDP-N-acetylglucosamine 1-carboxyvinyltransferase [Epulopiscium sp.]|jgi:UDP-N-acetylglucosamine 1-carboxyvinyltransferase|nr:UDP-N-acetylglucosamine 1-carboxyvinyltransferase [Candidatus Epulonipiscium sp.]HOQ16541.1 UDP-N-acetylglucosamine 1-carboxyvinyltransferase [Defluviitaleaceae bacterium]HPT75863.1 UDP-N-acetylglucosamine 1-carboxyvinyltransferase [Defluviitaleaceae bacterium]
MGRFYIDGGRCLEGTLRIQGGKNAVLPILAATVLNGDVSYIQDCPRILDVFTMIRILESIGCKVRWDDKTLMIDSSSVDSYKIPEELVREMRSSIILLGSVLGRHKKVIISYPGGCPLGPRPIDLHIKALKQLGASIKEEHGFIICEAPKLVGAKIHLDFPSVGATENIMLAAVLAEGTTEIHNAAKEPEIKDLQDFLNGMGAKIKGASSDVITIEGVKSLHQVEHKVIPDRIVTGTYLAAAAITGGEVLLTNVNPNHIQAINSKLKEAGCRIIEEKDRIYLKAPKKLKNIDIIRTQPYPGFPTDMQAQMMAMLTVASGASIITETVFESRYKHVDELIRMGANITLEGRTAIIKGVGHLTGTNVYAKDLRGGAALIIAGLVAEGVTIVDGAKHIERGYEQIDKDLNILGASIRKD